MTPGELGRVGVKTLLHLVIPKLSTSCGRTAPGLACIHGGIVVEVLGVVSIGVYDGLTVPVNPGGGGKDVACQKSQG